MAPFAMVKQRHRPSLQIGMTVTGAIIAVMVLLMLRRDGVRVIAFRHVGSDDTGRGISAAACGGHH